MLSTLSSNVYQLFKKLEEKNYTAYYDVPAVEIRGNDKRISIFFEKVEPFVYAEFYSEEFIEKELLEILFDICETFAKNEKAILLMIRGNLQSELELEATEYLLGKNYIPVDSTFDTIFHEDVYIKKEELQKAKVFVSFYEELKEVFKKCEETLLAFKKYQNYSELDDEFTFRFHYVGFEGMMKVEPSGESIKIIVTEEKEQKEKEYLVEKVKNVEETVLTIFKEIQKKERVKSIFKESKVFFEHMLNIDFPINLKKDMINLLYSEVRKKYSPLEIEELSSEIIKSKKSNFLHLRKEVVLVNFGAFTFLIDAEEKKVHTFEKTEENSPKILEYIARGIEEKIKDFLVKE